jgi:hypothetical protein
MTEAERVCSAAISYADLGFLVLPIWWVRDGRCGCGNPDCSSPGKHPWGRHAPNGLLDATGDGAVICSWFANGHVPNIAIRTGVESGALVIDSDPRHGGDKSLPALGDLPQTATVATGGDPLGRHIYFKMPPVDIRSFSADRTPKLGPGIDVRANGGYVVVPPSTHISGREYRWLIDPRAGLAELPQQILDKLIDTHAVRTSATVENAIPKGQRDNTLTSLAGTMRRRGMSEAAILAALREENARCEEPLPDKDLVRISRSIGKKEPAEAVGRRQVDPVCIEQTIPFPVSCLPERVARFVDISSRAIGCDPSYVALPLLAGLASAIGNTRRIQLKRGWSEPAVVWAAIVGDSGTLKSPALEVALRAVRKRQRAAMKRHAEAMALYEIESMRYEKELRAWKNAKANEEPPQRPAEPVADRCYADDTTIEALAVLLLQNPRGLLLVRDELSGWLGSFDRYAQGRGADAAKWLEMFGGRSIMVDRKSGPSRTIYVHRAAVSVAGGIQPGTLQRALGMEHRENGLAARLLLACPSRRAKRWTEADISPELENQIEAIFERLYSLEPGADRDGEIQPLDLPLTPAAKDAWVAFYDEHAIEQAELTGDLAATWSKLEGYAARLALIVHLTRWAAGDPTLEDANVVDEQSIKAGVELSTWFGHEARRVYSILGENPEQREHRRLIEMIRSKGGSVTIREVQRSSRKYTNAKDAEQALEALVAAGVGIWEDPKPGLAGGRPVRQFVLAQCADADKTCRDGP